MTATTWRPAITTDPVHVRRIALFHDTPLLTNGDHIETTWNGITFRAYQAAREVAS